MANAIHLKMIYAHSYSLSVDFYRGNGGRGLVDFMLAVLDGLCYKPTQLVKFCGGCLVAIKIFFCDGIFGEDSMSFCVRNRLCLVLLLLLLASACGDKPSADARYVVTDNDAGAVAIVFSEQRENGQYCVYRKDFAIGENASVGLLDMKASGDTQLLTPRTVNADDLRHAVQTESVYTSYTLSTVAYAVFPTATVCLATFTTWVATRNTAVGRATLLTCIAGMALIGTAFATEAEGKKQATDSVAAVLSPEMYHADETLPRVEKVLTWLVTENSLPCDAEKGTSP